MRAPDEIWTYSVDATTGTIANTSTAPTGFSPECMILAPSGKFAYVTDRIGNSIYIYSVDPASGALTLQGIVPTPVNSNPRAIVIDPKGKFAFVGFATLNAINVYSVDPVSGNLRQTSQFQTVTNTSFNPQASIGGTQATEPWLLAMHPSGSFLYCSYNDFAMTTAVTTFRIDPNTGLLTNSGTVGAGDTGYGLYVEGSGHYLYKANHGVNGADVTVFAIDPILGTLTPGPSFPAGWWAEGFGAAN
jgi:6-phosphogluconolactonase (cycloisomerase 2 family)